ncbi:MAG: NUDIX hydrolase [Phycisphaerae bacterium]
MAESVNVLADGKFVQLVDKDGWEYVRRKNISGIAGLVARTDEGRMVLVEQYRPPVGADVIELPAGLGDVDGEPLIDCGRRELIEETGYEAGSVKLLVSGAASAGSTAEILTMYLATDLKKVGDGGGDHSENITVHEIPLDEVEAWLDRQAEAGKVIDLKIYLGLYYLMK